MKTKKIKYEAEYNFKLIGISSSEDDYRLSWKLGKFFKAEFVKQEDIEIKDKKYTETQILVSYKCQPSNISLSLRLIVNKTNVGYIVEELKSIDYFLQVFDNQDEAYFGKIISDIKTISSVSAVFNLDLSKIKSKEKLLY
ncbi:MAG TPA: IPExxxVDY family protein [Bacteroidales bacterium]|nr:IPExxxVDY family protein [Bacteroidales bacterium]